MKEQSCHDGSRKSHYQQSNKTAVSESLCFRKCILCHDTECHRHDFPA
ncbi:MAG: hypothetical protein IIZ53_03850 [Ruminococcus sp.]|nr:hypothetical protein [Ruminococcus sp.]